jgi:hypothetical protein
LEKKRRNQDGRVSWEGNKSDVLDGNLKSFDSVPFPSRPEIQRIKFRLELLVVTINRKLEVCGRRILNSTFGRCQGSLNGAVIIN